MACPILHRAAIKRIVAERSSSGESSPVDELTCFNQWLARDVVTPEARCHWT